MKKIKALFFALTAILLVAMRAFAQGGTAAVEPANNSVRLTAIAAGIGLAIAVFRGALGQSRVGAAAAEGAARNPGAAGRIQTMMILALALIESLVLFALLVIFIKT